jgi:hypothetical protein
VLIVVSFHDALRLKKAFSGFCKEDVPVAQLLINRGYSGLTQLERQ